MQADLPVPADLPIDLSEHLKPPAGHPGGLEPALENVTEYAVTGMRGRARSTYCGKRQNF